MDMSKMGAFLQMLRKEQGLTQEQLGEKLHISSKTISRWETGTYMPPVEMLLALSELYGVSMNELVAGERLTPEELPVKAEENLTAAFQLSERKDFWQKKWNREHRGIMYLTPILFLCSYLVGMILDLHWLSMVMILAAVALSLYLTYRRDDYVEHHLYDDKLDN